MKKFISVILCFLGLLVFCCADASADIGPKPSVVIDFKGLEGTTYYVTMLSSLYSNGPRSAYSGEGWYAYDESYPDYFVFLRFVEYEDSDGFYFLQTFDDCSNSHHYIWGYYPPDIFKILLYFPETDSFIVSEICERYAFDSYFTVTVNGSALDVELQETHSIVVEKSYGFTVEIVSLVVRVLLTVAIEIGIALLFGFRGKKQLRFIMFVNIVTQLALNLVLNITPFRSGPLYFDLFFFFDSIYGLFEAAVFGTEAILYAIFLKKKSEMPVPRWKPWVYAAAANVVSFMLGLRLMVFIPQIF